MTSKSMIWTVAFALPLLCVAAPSSSSYGADVTLEAYTSLRGGARQGAGLHGLALIHSGYEPAVTSDDRVAWSGYVSVLALSGQGPTERYVGDFLAVSNMEGYDSTRLYSWWFEGKYRNWSLRTGALLADEEFAGTDGGGNFFNSAFGWPVFVSANTVNTGPAFYVAALGIRLEHKWRANAAWRVGIYDGDSFDSPVGDPRKTRHGLHYEVGGDQGWFVMTEATYAPGSGATRLKTGAWLHTAAFVDVRDDAAGQPFVLSGNEPREYGSNHGGYAAIEHTLAGKSGEAGNLEFFVRGGVSPADRNAISWALDTGLSWTGPLPGRPADVAALGFAHARFGSRFATGALLADPASRTPDFEQVIEASYTFTLNERVSLQPDLQYIRHPGGSTAQRDALVFLFRLNASY